MLWPVPFLTVFDHQLLCLMLCYFHNSFLKYRYRQIAPPESERKILNLARLLRRRERCVRLLLFTLNLLLFNSFPEKKDARVKHTYRILAKENQQTSTWLNGILLEFGKKPIPIFIRKCWIISELFLHHENLQEIPGYAESYQEHKMIYRN